MPTRHTEPLPTVKTVKGSANYILAIEWTDGTKSRVDMSAVIERFKPFAPLADVNEFKAVEPINYGQGIGWANGLDYSADNLARMARTQKAVVKGMSAAYFRTWQVNANLTNEIAASVLGMKTRQIIKYRKGDANIPMPVQMTIHRFEEEPGLLNAILPTVRKLT